MQIFFPNLATYVIIIVITNVIFLISINKKDIKNLTKFINSIFFIIIMVMMIYTLEQIISNNINIYDTEEVYTNQNVLVLIESTTILFTIWMIILLSKLAISKLIKKSDEKIKEEYKKEQKPELEIKSEPIFKQAPTEDIETLNLGNDSSKKDSDDIETLEL